jgi:DNA-binding transcriptional MerR regulator
MSDPNAAGEGRSDGRSSEPDTEDLPENAPAEYADIARQRPRKAPEAFRTISEVADDLHIPQHVLRFWETKFPQVKPLKRGGGRRYYRPDDIALLRRISGLLYVQGYTIKGVQRLLREGGGRLSDDIPPPAPDDLVEPEDTADTVAATGDCSQPQLAMQDLAAAPHAMPPPRAVPAPSAPAEQEVLRLRAVVAEILEELEILRALLP